MSYTFKHSGISAANQFAQQSNGFWWELVIYDITILQTHVSTQILMKQTCNRFVFVDWYTCSRFEIDVDANNLYHAHVLYSGLPTLQIVSHVRLIRVSCKRLQLPLYHSYVNSNIGWAEIPQSSNESSSSVTSYNFSL